MEELCILPKLLLKSLETGTSRRAGLCSPAFQQKQHRWDSHVAPPVRITWGHEWVAAAPGNPCYRQQRGSLQNPNCGPPLQGNSFLGQHWNSKIASSRWWLSLVPHCDPGVSPKSCCNIPANVNLTDVRRQLWGNQNHHWRAWNWTTTIVTAGLQMPSASGKNEYINVYVNDCGIYMSKINHMPALYNFPVNIRFNEDGYKIPDFHCFP